MTFAGLEVLDVILTLDADDICSFIQKELSECKEEKNKVPKKSTQQKTIPFKVAKLGKNPEKKKKKENVGVPKISNIFEILENVSSI